MRDNLKEVTEQEFMDFLDQYNGPVLDKFHYRYADPPVTAFVTDMGTPDQVTVAKIMWFEGTLENGKLLGKDRNEYYIKE